MTLLRFRWILRWRTWLLALVLVAAAGLLDLRMLRRQTLWVDELFSLAMATGHSVEHPAADADLSRGDFVQAERPVTADDLRRFITHDHPAASFERVTRAVFLSDTSPPLYYLLLNLWTRLIGTSDGALRSFSVGWFLACIPLVLLLARRVAGPRAELAAGLLFISAPGAVYYSTEGRMYSLLWFCVVSTALLSLVVRDRKRTFAFDLLWILASAAGLLVHYFFLFPWCAMVAFLALRPGADTRVRWLGRLLLVALLVAPWYRHLPASLHHWRITQDWLNWTPSGFNRLRAIGELGLQFFSNDGHYLWWDEPKIKWVLFAAFGLLGLVVVLRLRERGFTGNRLLLWGWFGAAWAGPVVFDLARHSFTVAIPRYAISALPAASLLSALALSALPRVARYLVLATIVGAWGFSLADIYNNPSRDDQPFWKLSQVLGAESRETDLILVHSIPTGVVGVARYVQTPARFADWIGQLSTRKVPDSIIPLITGFRRVFFIRFHEVGAAAPEETWLREHADIVRETHYGLIIVVEFRPKQTETF